VTPQELKASILQLAIQGKLVEQRPEEGSGGELLERIFAAKNAKDAKGAKRAKKNSRAEPRRTSHPLVPRLMSHAHTPL